jgi:hypothetical protein
MRKQVDKCDVPVVIVGDSRILFDTDLDRAAQLTGVRCNWRLRVEVG